MSIEKGDVVMSLSGRDKDRLFYVIDNDSEYYYLCDGRLRHIDKPKKKKKKHTVFYCKDDSRVADKIRTGEYVNNAELRKGLNQLQNTIKGGE